MEHLPNYDSWRLAEPPSGNDCIPKEHRVTVEVSFRAMLAPADAELVAERIAKRLGEMLAFVEGAYIIEVTGTSVSDLWQVEED